jgi:hypothetical protein
MCDSPQALAVPAPAQVAAAISGNVEDASSAAVRKATVTVRSLETAATRVVTTDEVGNYRVLSHGIGPHEVRASKTGFRTEIRNHINLEVGQDAVVNLRLEHIPIADIVVRAHGGEDRNASGRQVRLASPWAFPAEAYGINYRPVEVPELAQEPFPGLYAVSGHLVARIPLFGGGEWLRRMRPVAIVGHAIYIYDVPAS